MKLSRLVQRLLWRVRNVVHAPQPGPAPVTRAISISMVKNEQDIIEPFLRHNRQFFDAMIVLDHGSTDRTAEIIENCARELGGIVFTHIAKFEYEQSAYMTAALHYVQSGFFADFVCFLDADEFIPSTDRTAFLHDLSVVPVGQASEHMWQTFLPDPDATPGAGRDWLDDMVFRRAEERPQRSKCFFRLGGGTEPDLTVWQGNHGFSLGGQKVRRHLIGSVPLRHMPVRSATQIITRGAVGWAANLARKAASPGSKSAFQWKRLHELARKGDFTLSQTALCDEAMAYAQHHLPERFSDNAVPARHGILARRKYSDGQSAEPYRTIATSLLQTETYRPFDPGTLAQPHGATSAVAPAFDAKRPRQGVFLDAPPLRYLAQKHRPASVLDVGCGTGLNLRLMQHDGVGDVLGVDGLDPHATALDDRTYIKADLQRPFDAGRSFDLVMCLGVADRIAAPAAPVLFDTIERHARGLIVFSMAEPGQPGTGQINCQPMSEVLALWKSRGWTPDLIETLGVRALSTVPSFRRNIVVLCKRPAQDDSATDALLRIARLRYRWPIQENRLHQTAFEQAFPPRAMGYGRVASRRLP